MVDMERIEHLIIGSHTFSKDEYVMKYRFLLVSSMLMAGSIISFFASMMRLLTHSYTLGVIDLFLSLSLFGLYVLLRKDRNSFNFVSNIALVLQFIFFTSIVILLEYENSKLLWYPLLIAASFMIKGDKVGLRVFAVVVVTLVTLHISSFVDIHLSNYDVALAIAAYAALSLFMTFSELQQSKNIQSIYANHNEIAKQKNMLYKQARTMDITKLPNKIVLNEDIENSKGEISCIVMDIDDFDIIAHKFGEEFTDHLLREVAEVLKNITTKDISLYHIYGERFAFLIRNHSLDDDLLFARNIELLFKSVQIKHKKIELAINFIITIVHDKAKTLSHANMMLREIKRGNQSNCKIYRYDPKQEEIQKNNLYWAKRLTELIEEDNIVVYYQPIIDNGTKEIVKYECLVRAIDGDKIVTPYFFLSVAKSKGLLRNITEIVIDKSFKLFSTNDYEFSINITEQDLSENYLVDFLSKKIKEYNIDPKRVFLEVLENINAEDSNYANEQFEKLRELGFGLAIDDFGAEASNLSRLLTLRADLIKIDGQFVKHLDTDPESIKIVETIVLLAKKMDVKTVAEFVHNEEIYKIVKKLGVDFSQGYYFSPPLPQVEEKQIKELKQLCA